MYSGSIDTYWHKKNSPVQNAYRRYLKNVQTRGHVDNFQLQIIFSYTLGPVAGLRIRKIRILKTGSGSSLHLPFPEKGKIMPEN